MIEPDKGTPIGLDETDSSASLLDKGTPIGLATERAEGDEANEEKSGDES
jgi:hypothetical protein